MIKTCIRPITTKIRRKFKFQVFAEDPNFIIIYFQYSLSVAIRLTQVPKNKSGSHIVNKIAKLLEVLHQHSSEAIANVNLGIVLKKNPH